MQLIAPLGLAAALLAHVLLQAIADCGLGAPGFKAHAHTAVAPAAFAEIVLALWLAGMALRDALRTRTGSYYEIAMPARLGTGQLTIAAGLVALSAIASLFGLEYAESGNAAFGLGWLGGALVPGAIALLIAIASAVGALWLALAGHLAGFEHLIALFAAILARLFATFLAPTLAPQTVTTRPLTMRRAPVAHHAGLRAPPKPTR